MGYRAKYSIIHTAKRTVHLALLLFICLYFKQFVIEGYRLNKEDIESKGSCDKVVKGDDTFDDELCKEKSDNDSVSTNDAKMLEENSPRNLRGTNCNEILKAGFGKNIPLRFLISFPRSGNTWLRYLLECASGLVTGSVYSSPTLFKYGFAGENDHIKSGRTLIVKAHMHDRMELLNQKRNSKSEDQYQNIFLFRNPARSIISNWHFTSTNKGYAESVNASTYNTTRFHDYVKRFSAKSNQETLYILRNITFGLLVYYENLVADPIKDVRKILVTLGMTPDEERLRCLNMNLVREDIKRKHLEQFNPYTTIEEENLRKSLAEIVRNLKNFDSPIPKIYQRIIANETNILGDEYSISSQ